MDWGDRVDQLIDWAEQTYLLWIGALLGAALGCGVALLTDLSALPLAIVGAPVGGALGVVGARAEDREG